MEYVKLGRTGMDVSRLCLGCMSYGDPGKGAHAWSLSEEDSRPFIRKAVEGRALKEFARRDEIVLATKVFNRMHAGPNGAGLSRKAILSEIDKSLKRLGTDYVDLYQIHRFDKHTPIEETLDALNDVVRAGKARYIGASSMYAWQFGKMLATSEKHGWARFVTMQNYLNLLYREEEREMLPLCLAEGIGLMPWSPLARGRLTRPWGTATSRSETDQFGGTLYANTEEADRRVVEAVGQVAEKRGVPRAQVALAWVLQKPMTTPIVGATKPHHLDDAVRALELRLNAEEIAQLEAPYVPHTVVGFS
jgi:aryl-alcohol dehydrogenase-like predicted oxidoreductase